MAGPEREQPEAVRRGREPGHRVPLPASADRQVRGRPGPCVDGLQPGSRDRGQDPEAGWQPRQRVCRQGQGWLITLADRGGWKGRPDPPQPGRCEQQRNVNSSERERAPWQAPALFWLPPCGTATRPGWAGHTRPGAWLFPTSDLAEADAAVDGGKPQLRAAVADGASEAPSRHLAGDQDREVAVDAAVHGAG